MLDATHSTKLYPLCTICTTTYYSRLTFVLRTICTKFKTPVSPRLFGLKKGDLK
jgi:hypothetical protein